MSGAPAVPRPMSPTIVTLTINPALDLATEADKVAPTDKIRCAPPRVDAGGGGINVARVIHILGGSAGQAQPVRALFLAGGATGARLDSLLAEHGLPREKIAIAGETRESFAVTETSSRRMYRFVLPGPTVSDQECRAVLDHLAAIDPAPAFLAASGSLAPGMHTDFFARLSETVRASGTKFVLDTSGKPLKLAVEAGVDVIKPNLRELSDITDDNIESRAARKRAIRKLVDDGKAGLVALTLGKDGAMLASADGVLERTPPPIRAKESAVGAGDSFTAGLVLGLAEGRTLDDAFRLAMAAGAATLLTPGTALCERGEVERLYAAMAE